MTKLSTTYNLKLMTTGITQGILLARMVFNGFIDSVFSEIFEVMLLVNYYEAVLKQYYQKWLGSF